MSKVALFFRHGKPGRLSSSNLLIVQNWDVAADRMTKHRGFDSVEFSRIHTPLEAEQAAGFTRYRLMYYGSWPDLIKDEQDRYEEDARIGHHFLDSCIWMSQQPRYVLHHTISARKVAQNEADLLAEYESNQPKPLDNFEKRVVQDMARRMGVGQLELFGQDFLTEIL